MRYCIIDVNDVQKVEAEEMEGFFVLGYDGFILEKRVFGW